VARRRLALLVATYRYQDAGLRQLAAPGHDAEALAEVLRDPEIADFDVTVLVNEPHHVVGEAIGEFYHNRCRDDLALLYFTGHGLKDDQGRLYLAMANTKRDDLLFTGLSAQQIDDAMESCSSRQKILVLDCCYSGAFPAGRIAKTDPQVHTLEKFQGKGRVVLTASDATQYSFEGNQIVGQGTRSVFTRFLVEGLTTGDADLDSDGDISLDELYSYVHDRVIEEMPQQRPKKQENVEGRIVIARNIHWRLPTYVRNAIESPFARDRLAVLESLVHLHRVGNDLVQAEVINQTRRLIHDTNKAVSRGAMDVIRVLHPELTRREPEEQARPEPEEPRWAPAVTSRPRHSSAEKQAERQVATPPTLSTAAADTTARSGPLRGEAAVDQYRQTGAATEKLTPQRARRDTEEQARRKANRWTAPSWFLTPVRRRYGKQAEGQDASETQVSRHISLPQSWGLSRLTRYQMALATSVAVVIISLVVVLVVIIPRSVGSPVSPVSPTTPPLAGTDGTSSSGSPTPTGSTEFRSEQAGFELAYPSSWSNLNPTDPQILLLRERQGTQDSLLVRASDLQEPVGPQQLPAMKQVTDKLVTSNKTVQMVAGPNQIELGGLPGLYYFYNFTDSATGQQGAHSHFFLFNGKTMISIVFQTLPKERFTEEAKTFDQVLASFHALNK
jgi:uncharacterized caspase-like protein